MRRAVDIGGGPRRRLRAAGVIILGALVVGGFSLDGPAAADSDDETTFVDAINRIRADLDLAPLEPHVELAALAREHAELMAEAGEIFHADPISAGLTADWMKLGENVGVGAGVGVLVDAFLASPGHYANIIDPSFTHIGVGVFRDGEALYTTHRFLQPPGAIDEVAEPPPPTIPTSSSEDPDTASTNPTVSPERIVALLALLDDVG